MTGPAGGGGRRVSVALTALGILGLAAWLWGFGGALRIEIWAAAAQAEAQAAMAQGLRALKAGQPGAWWGLMTICAAYGFFHAAGPGHGKVVLGGYGMARRVTLWRLSALAVVSSLAQAATAVLLVLSGVWVFDWGRERMSDLAERLFAPLSYGLMAALGFYLVLRGLRRAGRLWRAARPVPPPAGALSLRHPPLHPHPQADHAPHDHTHDHAHDHTHPHGDGAVCADCGHRHGPTLEEAAEVRSLREALAIVLAIAARPCTGAIFLLLLTWRLEILPAGIAGAFAMGLGTATVTLMVALLASGLRGSLLARGLIGPERALRLATVLEIAAGFVVMLLCLQLLLRSL